jgi:adenylate cyclase
MDSSLFDEYFASTLVGSLGVALGLAFLAIQQRSKATWGLTGAWITLGLCVILLPPNANLPADQHVPLSARMGGLMISGSIAASNVYISGVLDTAASSARAERFVRRGLLAGWGLAGLFVFIGTAFPREGLNDFAMGLSGLDVLSRPGFWLYASFFIVLGVLYAAIWAALARQRLDVGERARAGSAAVGVPIMATAAALPYRVAMVAWVVALVIMLLGLFRYHVAQGERSAFLSRFLSPQVMQLVRSEGMAEVMRPHEVELTVVACDLRGFTAYSEAVPSQVVIDLLTEYYDAVGTAVADVDGTVKDYAGDGVLTLIGAPIKRDDHAEAGLRLAARLHQLVQPVLRHWATGPHPLGLGIGVASGTVTVGALGSSSRMEYTAVGNAVNIAARLCSAAGDGETLVGQATAGLAPTHGLRPRGSMQIKGLSADHSVYALDPRGDGSLSPAPGSTTS